MDHSPAPPPVKSAGGKKRRETHKKITAEKEGMHERTHDKNIRRGRGKGWLSRSHENADKAQSSSVTGKEVEKTRETGGALAIATARKRQAMRPAARTIPEPGARGTTKKFRKDVKEGAVLPPTQPTPKTRGDSTTGGGSEKNKKSVPITHHRLFPERVQFLKMQFAPLAFFVGDWRLTVGCNRGWLSEEHTQQERHLAARRGSTPESQEEKIGQEEEQEKKRPAPPDAEPPSAIGVTCPTGV